MKSSGEHAHVGPLRGTILLAGESADMRDYAATLLAGHYQIQAATNGEDALACALADPPDLVLADAAMPGMDGISLLRAVRQRPELGALPVILLSAQADEEALIEGLEAGASDYLVKPFTVRELLARVRTHINMARVRKQAAEGEAKLLAEAEAARDEAIRILESIQDAFATFDREWRFIYVNPETERLTGMRREDLLGRSHWDVFADTRDTVVEREYCRAVRDQATVEFEYLHAPWDRWFAIKGYPTREGGLSIYFRDITAQKKSEAHLRESEQRLRAIYDGTYEYIGLLAPDGTVLEANRASLEFAGNRREDVVGLPFWNTPWFTATPGAPETVRQGVARAAGGEFVRFEATVRRPSGERLDFDISFHPVRNERGDVVLIVPEGRNITERKQAEERMRRQWHAFDTALSHTPDFTYTFDLDGRFTYVNQALLSLWQKPLEEALGKNFFDLEYPPDLAERLQRQIRQVIDSRQPLRDHTPFTGPTGEARNYEYIFVPVLAANGNVEAVAGSTRDITERQRSEEQERERQIQLRDSARLESLGVMAGGIAHDFNNLLVGILGNASLLVESQPGNGSFASQIVMAAERAAELTKQMLAYSGKGSFVIEVLDLNALIRENLTLFRSSLSRSVNVELEIGCDGCLVEGDRTQIHQAIMNLLINASEAVGDRPGEVRIRTSVINGREPRFSSNLHESVPAGNYALLEVWDNGIGIAPETAQKIFDPFFTTKFTGRGLGLAAVLGIVKGHRGDIEVESQPGAGAAFRIYLPLSHRAGSPRREPEAGAAVATGQSVLVVDDEPIVTRLAAVALERGGFRVLVAANGEEALEVLRTNPGISLVILDLTMPVMTGEQTLPVIRARYPEIPVILSSGFNEAEISRRFESAGIAGVLQKPYTVSGIVLKVKQAIQEARLVRSQSHKA